MIFERIPKFSLDKLLLILSLALSAKDWWGLLWMLCFVLSSILTDWLQGGGGGERLTVELLFSFILSVWGKTPMFSRELKQSTGWSALKLEGGLRCWSFISLLTVSTVSTVSMSGRSSSLLCLCLQVWGGEDQNNFEVKPLRVCLPHWVGQSQNHAVDVHPLISNVCLWSSYYNKGLLLILLYGHHTLPWPAGTGGGRGQCWCVWQGGRRWWRRWVTPWVVTGRSWSWWGWRSHFYQLLAPTEANTPTEVKTFQVCLQVFCRQAGRQLSGTFH